MPSASPRTRNSPARGYFNRFRRMLFSRGSNNNNNTNSSVYRSNKLTRLKKEKPFISFKKVLLGMGLGSLALYGGAMHQKYKPAGRVGNVMPWKNAPSTFFGGANAKVFANLKRSGVPIEYTYKTRYIGGASVQEVNKYRYTVEKPTPAKVEWWPTGVPLNWGGRVTSAGICATLAGLGAVGILTTKEAAALCAIVMARHYEPAQLLAFQMAIINIISGYAAWKHEKEWNAKQQEKIKEAIKEEREKNTLQASQKAATATKNLATVARRTLIQEIKVHQQRMPLESRKTSAAERAANAAERAANAATSQALVGLLEEARRRGVELGTGPEVEQALIRAFIAIRDRLPVHNNRPALQGPHAQPLLLLQQANSSGSQRNFKANTSAQMLRVQTPRTTPQRTPRRNNNNNALLARVASTVRATAANRKRR